MEEATPINFRDVLLPYFEKHTDGLHFTKSDQWNCNRDRIALTCIFCTISWQCCITIALPDAYFILMHCILPLILVHQSFDQQQCRCCCSSELQTGGKKLRSQDPGTLREIAMHCMVLRGIAVFRGNSCKSIAWLCSVQ